MRKRLTFLLAAMLLAILPVTNASASGGTVTYSGAAGEFIFEPGSTHSATDLFTNFKDVMPGDVLTDTVTVRNDGSKDIRARIYMRALGAGEGSEEFLSKLRLQVNKSGEWTYMFDAAASETAGLTSWTLLGTLYSGGEVNLELKLIVPTELGPEWQYQVGYLDWEFLVEELPKEPDDPTPPTGGQSNVLPWAIALSASSVILLLLVFWFIWDRKRRKKEDQ